MNEQTQQAQDQMRRTFEQAQEWTTRSARAWNELVTTSTDMAFDVVLKNWDYSRSIRSSAEQAIEDAIKTQQRLTSEMLQVWTGYATAVQDVASRTAFMNGANR
ncbi:MAG: hypothetical protein NZ518_03065 [Dehalococcoidia bacterium]|nr:hypothetical protein [Dehalococcoidia bacterium]